MTLAPLYHLWSQRPWRRRPRAALQEGTARAQSRRGEPQVSAAGRGGRGAHRGLYLAPWPCDTLSGTLGRFLAA